jgi:SAM-dependent methyltransferase
LLRGRLDGRRRVLDAGCGGGRNLPYFLNRGFDVHAIDENASAVAATRSVVRELGLDADIRHGSIAAMPWSDASFDFVISSAVLHFVSDIDRFHALVDEMWRVLAPGGILFARLASSIGIESRLPRTTGRVGLPDGSERFVVDRQMLVETTRRLGGTFLDPIKTTVVEDQRSMTTWVVEKD